MADIRLVLTGTTPLMCHNPNLSDPDHPITRQIKAITSKTNKTEDDRRAIDKLEWYGGLYTAPDVDGPAMPTPNILSCLIAGATKFRKGTAVSDALSFRVLHVPIGYDGPRAIDELWAGESCRIRMPVVVQRQRTWRMRPGFMPWSVAADAFLAEDELDFEEFVRIVQRAGLSKGLGEGRKIGFGRFEGKATRR